MDLDSKIIQWGRDRGITNPDKQTIKLLEECGELAHEICRGDYHSELVLDAIGDIQVVIIILADILGYDAEECKAYAYDAISSRKGETKDGCFVKGGENA